MAAENLAFTKIRSPDGLACSQSLYRLSHRGPLKKSILFEAKFRAFDALYFIFLLLKFRKFVKPNRSFKSKCDPNIRDGFLRHNESRTSRIHCLRQPVPL
jgi:hypothetical protein